MPLIESSVATNKLNAPAGNLDALLHLKEPSDRRDVITQMAVDCLEEMRKSQLGWGHYLKKFLATSLTYTSALALPVGVLVGAIWYSLDAIKHLYTQLGVKDAALLGSEAGALFLADYAIGRTFGVRPITAILIAAYDAYRQGAKYLSNEVKASYLRHEAAMQTILQNSKEALQKDLSETYAKIAEELVKKARMGKVEAEIKILKFNLPIIRKAFLSMGLTNIEIRKILHPLENTLTLLEGKRAFLPLTA